MRYFQFALWGAVILLGGFLAYATINHTAERAGLKTPTGTGGDIGGPFTAVRTDGTPFSRDQMLGRPHVLFFGFTHCPDICPATLHEASQWLQKLGPDGDKLDVYFVTVDPERDSPEILGEYMSLFDERLIGLSGSPEQIAKLTRAWRVFVKKQEPDEDGDYNVDHTATTYLMNADGGFVRTIAYGESNEVAVEKLQKLIAGR